MDKVTCINCGRRYRVKEGLARKALTCPNCAMPIPVGGQENSAANAEQLRAELVRLASDQAGPEPSHQPERRPSAAPGQRAEATRKAGASTVQVAPPSPAEVEQRVPAVKRARKDYTGLVVPSVLILMLAVGGALGAVWYTSRAQQARDARTQDAEAVEGALAVARASSEPGHETEAVRAWENAQQLARDFEQQYGGGDYLSAIAEAEEALKNLRSELARRNRTFAEVHRLLAQAKQRIEEEDFAGAREDLQRVLALVQACRFPDEKVRQAGVEAGQLLATDDIRYRSQGLVKHGEKWVTSEEREELLMAEKGLVKYEGEWIAPEERDRRTEEERAALAKRQEQARERFRRSQYMREQQLKVQKELREGASQVRIETGTEFLRWSGEQWANPVELRVQEGVEGRNGFIAVDLKDGNKGKWVVSIMQPGDIRGYDEVRLLVDTRQKVDVALGVWTMPGYRLFETRAVPVNGRTEVSFNLKAKDFKCRETGWVHGGEIANPESMSKLSLFFYSGSEKPVRLKDLRIVKKSGAKRPTGKGG